MTRYFLRSVSIEGFRGVNNEGSPLKLSFKSDRVNSVFAPNGSGKSSLYEALEYAFRGKVTHLESMQSTENPSDYIANLFHSQKKATIVIRLEPDSGGKCVEIVVTRESDGTRTVSSNDESNPELLLRSLDEDFSLLNYKSFNKFIEDTALERGRSFSSLLGLSEYGEFLKSIKSMSNAQAFKSDFNIGEIEARIESRKSEAARALRDYTAHFNKCVTDEDVDVDAASINTMKILKDLQKIELFKKHTIDCKELEEVDFDTLKSAIFQAEDGKLRERHEGLSKASTYLSSLVSSRPNEDVAATLRRTLETYLEARSSATEHELQELLEAASRYFHLCENEVSECPLCEREGASALTVRVDERLGALAELRSAEERVHQEITNGRFLSRLFELEKSVQPPLDDEPSVADVIRSCSQEEVLLTVEQVELARRRLGELEELLGERLKTVENTLESVESSLPPSLVRLSEKIGAAEAASTEQVRYHEAIAAVGSDEKKLNIFNRWKRFVDLAHRTFADAESDMSQSILANLRTEYQDIFTGIMNVPEIVPELNRSRRSEQLAVELSDFHGAESVSARAVLSESYRNALAVAVFLAAASKHNRAPRFVVLDDITSSFDAGHQFRLMEQLRTRLQHDGSAGGLQIILLSHDVTLEKYFDRLAGSGKWNHQKLQGWPPVTPVTSLQQDHNQLRADADRYLRAGQIPEGAGLIRQYLEFVVLQIIRKVKIPVPIDLAVNDHAAMVGNCLDAIIDAVNVRSALGTIVLDQQQIDNLTGRHVPAIVSNWVSHYGSAASASFSPSSLLAVLSDIDALRRCFQYDSSGTGSWQFYQSLTKR